MYSSYRGIPMYVFRIYWHFFVENCDLWLLHFY